MFQQMKKILLGGYYGGNNTGDEAILRATIDTFQAIRPDLSFTVVSHAPVATEKRHAVQAVNWRDMPALAKAVSQADLVLIGGGGLFMDYWGLDEDSYFRVTHGGISTYGTLALLADAFDVPYILHGVGVGPLDSKAAREHTRRIFSRARLATVRDAESLALLEDIGLKPLPEQIRLFADLAFSLESSPIDLDKAAERRTQLGLDQKTPLLGVAIRFWDRPEPPSVWIPPLAEAVREFLTQSRANALLLPFQMGSEGQLTDDLQLSRLLASEIDLPGQVCALDDVLHPGEMQAMLGECDLILGMRLHALIMGLNNHIPVIGLAYDSKITSLMKQANLDEFISPVLVEPQRLAQMLALASQEKASLSAKIKPYQEKMQALVNENIQLVLPILDAQRSMPSYANLHGFLIERLAQMQTMDAVLLEKETRIQTLSAEANEAHNRAALLELRLKEIESSQTYRLALLVQRLRNALIPPNSRRETWLRSLQTLSRRKAQH